jgi:uncharacterized membrane protein YgcG
MRPFLRTLLPALALLLSWAAPAHAEERILDFESHVVVSANGGLTVTETITVEAEGRNIKRGIYRDFPTRYKGPAGRSYNVGFEVVSVLRDGQRENWFTKNRSNGVRIYAGRENVYLQSGQYEFTFTYRTSRQIGFFEDYDELYWNVTGHDWDFPIERARVTVVLPAGATIVQSAAYTGREGDTGQDWNDRTDERGNPVFESTRRLAPGEGLTVAVAWPKGLVAQPGFVEDAIQRLQDYVVYALGLGAFGVLLLFYLVAWHHIGRDPPKGAIVPRWKAPRGISPAAARYVTRMDFDKKALGAAVVNLAVKGHLTIEENGRREYILHKRTAPAQGKMSQGEKALKRGLFSWGDSVVVENGNHERLQPAVHGLESALSSNYEGAHFAHNFWVTVVGMVLTVLLIASSMLVGANLVRDERVIFVVAGIFFSGIVLNKLFGWLMKAPTMTGRRLMDEIDGFRMYLSTAEQERLNLLHPPDRTPELFEKYLPYAMALDVEHEWGEQFKDVLAAAATGGDGYSPHWYHGHRHWHSHGDFASSLGSDLSGSISSAATPPGSSSGSGGGGSSGGGGGGGGGGGW